MVEDSSPGRERPHSSECIACGNRGEAGEEPLESPDCGEQMQNIGKPRI